jgi:hypothetical protein
MSKYAEIKETIGEAETIYCTICNPYMLPSGYDTIDIKKDIKNLIDIIEKQKDIMTRCNMILSTAYVVENDCIKLLAEALALTE